MEARAIIRPDGEEDTSGVAVSIPWWSFTKTALSVALLRLWEEGRIDLDKAVEGHPFTPAHLLRHEAGLPDYGPLTAYHAAVEAGQQPWPVVSLLKAVEADRLRYAPGHGWAYSNVGYWQVSRLIERASDRPLQDALANLVFAPAELSTARLATSPEDLVNVAMGNVTDYHPGWVYHGLIVGTAMDAARLLRRLLQGRLLDSQTLSRMFEPRPLPQFRSALYPDPAYGMGIMLQASDPLKHPVGHTGSGPGSEIAVYGQGGETCAVWAASSTGIDPVAETFRTLKGARS
ncbi:MULTISPECIES: serine hydrolase domain-containing protein [unclassified Chelatococcus]|uniref:serine hydrolase domain-containing protein n=1 Tax=unclassified Chelatococcus TaxID=2638111 RepID=UPI001BCB1057|nr:MULTISPECIES: serine hydrolase domain-containing protein [unclassified Chelatococcus]MBS7700404.1 beta-lactamase family protein [Chelatococcus sp. YT9]MBX3556200.1 beta-lactamase family protein [Chelatococcus sp.]